MTKTYHHFTNSADKHFSGHNDRGVHYNCGHLQVREHVPHSALDVGRRGVCDGCDFGRRRICVHREARERRACSLILYSYNCLLRVIQEE